MNKVIRPPATLGFKMPAEWEKHEATWLVWPHNRETWPGEKCFSEVEDAYVQMLEALLPCEKVELLIPDEKTIEYVCARLKKRSVDMRHLHFRISKTVDSWIRDFGPIFVKNDRGEKAWCKWNFNAWGNKYADLACDHTVFEENAAGISYSCFPAGMILEGGSIEVNGAGICLVTEQCLLNPNRNPGFTFEKIEEYLRNFLGVSEIVWLKRGIAGDDTDGHIDDIARFVNPDTILIAHEENPADDNYLPLQKNLEILETLSGYRNKPWKIVKLPMPLAVVDHGARKPASYANFYIANGVVLLPVFGDPNDHRAAGILKEYFPDREIVLVPSRSLVYGFGAIHCITQQEPA